MVLASVHSSRASTPTDHVASSPCVPLQLGEVVERIGVGEFAGVD